MKIILQGDPILREYSEPISEFDKNLKKLVQDMWDTLRWTHGMGLAAPQVGISQRIILIDTKKENKKRGIRLCMINPEIISSLGSCIYKESCLSVPGTQVSINRHASIVIQYMDLSGNIISDKSYHKLNARVIQHEIDHLDGKLITDYEKDYSKVGNLDGSTHFSTS